MKKYLQINYIVVDQSKTTGKASTWMAVLPYVGIVLFLIQTGSIWLDSHRIQFEKEILLAGITNMIGIAGVGAGISHIFFSEKTTSLIGFQRSPYQLEVGFCDLSFGIVGLLAPYYSTDFWWAIILFSSLYRIGCGIGHIRQIILEKNYAVNNTMILIVDFGVPFILISMYLINIK